MQWCKRQHRKKGLNLNTRPKGQRRNLWKCKILDIFKVSRVTLDTPHSNRKGIKCNDAKDKIEKRLKIRKQNKTKRRVIHEHVKLLMKLKVKSNIPITFLTVLTFSFKRFIADRWIYLKKTQPIKNNKRNSMCFKYLFTLSLS